MVVAAPPAANGYAGPSSAWHDPSYLPGILEPCCKLQPASSWAGPRESRRLTRVRAQAVAEEPLVALVSGDAGVGRPRLGAELARVAAARGFMVLSGRCAELGDSVPYLPLADALHSAAHTSPALADAIAARPVLGMLLPDRDNAELAGGEGTAMAPHARCRP